jgi:hypothetical protein
VIGAGQAEAWSAAASRAVVSRAMRDDTGKDRIRIFARAARADLDRL